MGKVPGHVISLDDLGTEYDLAEVVDVAESLRAKGQRIEIQCERRTACVSQNGDGWRVPLSGDVFKEYKSAAEALQTFVIAFRNMEAKVVQV